jgi:hypothetical protein
MGGSPPHKTEQYVSAYIFPHRDLQKRGGGPIAA